MAINKHPSIITLNVHELNATTKCHRVAEWIRKLDPCISCLQETHLRLKDTHRLKVKVWKNSSCKWKGKKAGVPILISKKIDFKTKAIVSDKEGADPRWHRVASSPAHLLSDMDRI